VSATAPAVQLLRRAVLALALALSPVATALAQDTRPAAGSEAVELFDYTVVEGDTCAAISERFFGNRRRYDLIHAYNPGMGPPPHDLAAGTVLHLPRRATPAAALADATVTGVERRVEARPRPADEAWVAAQRGLGLYRGGRVATQARSTAELTFRDTSVVQLREETLVIIFGASSTTTRRAGMEATLETGALRTRLGELRGDRPAGEAPGGNTLRVVTGSGTASLEGGSAIVAVDPAGTSRLSNHSSQARLQAASGGRPVPLPENTGSMVRRGERPTPPRPLPPAPQWTGGPTHVLGYAGFGGSFYGEWSAVPGATRYRVEIARHSDGRDLVFATEVPAEVTRFEVQNLPAGSYYPFVSTIDGDLFEGRPSAPREVSIVEARMLAPGEDPSSPAPAYTARELDEASGLATLEGSRLVLPPGVRCEGAVEGLVAIRAADEGLTCTDAEGREVAPSAFVIEEVVTGIDGEEPTSDDRVSLMAGLERTIVLRPVANVPLPEDLELRGSEGIEVLETERTSDGVRARVRASSAAPEAGELRWVTARAPEQILGRLAVAVEVPSTEPVEPVVASPAPVRAPRSPRLTEAYSRSPVASALTLSDLDRRGSTVGLSLAEIAPRRSYDGSERTRIAIAGDVALLDDMLVLGTLVPIDVAGRHAATWERGSLDVWAHARWIPLRRDPAAEDSLALALDLGAWFPTHSEERSGLPLVRLAPSIEVAYALERIVSLRMRQGALLDLDDTGARLWASAYGLDVNVWGPFAVGIEVDMVLGPEIEADLFAVGLSPQLSLELAPVSLGLGMRFGLNRDGQALFGAASVALSGSVAIE